MRPSPIDRRTFLYGLGCTALAAQPGAPEPAILDPNRLAKFVDPLPIPPRAIPAPGQPSYYRMPMREVRMRAHRDLPPARVWGFGASSPGPTIEARRGEPITVEWVNELPDRHFLPIDHSLHGAQRGIPEVRTVIHLHGGRVPPESDGYPERWFTPGASAIASYPNNQDAAMLWYHDHAMAITRLNIMAGLFGLYLIRDSVEDALPLPRGEHEIPLVLFDRSLRRDGQLHYPVSANPAHPWTSEFFGEAVLANGKLFPYLEVEPRKYRLRVLNASNSRFYYLALRESGLPLWQIGSDQGLLAAPVEIERLTLAPGERADLIVDFKRARGRNLILASDTYDILQFRVPDSSVPDESAIPARLRDVPRLREQEAVRTRALTLEGSGDEDDPTAMLPMLLNGSRWHDPVTENPTLDSVEIWSLINLTDDAHPIHLHMVRFQILDRTPFNLFTYLNNRELRATGPAVPPEAGEAGWKDTVRADPGMVTRIVVRFEGYAGRYVWHCHVLEHEDNEMMRPYDVLPHPEPAPNHAMMKVPA